MDLSSAIQFLNENESNDFSKLPLKSKKTCEDLVTGLRLVYEKETNVSIKDRQVNTVLLQDLVDYFRNKNKFSFLNLIKFEPIFINIDVTKEISDACLFLIDGTSLILECFQNHRIDWNCGGQYLHLVYMFEKYIQMFSTLSDYFYIVFFSDLNSLFTNDSRFSLSLSVVINHLRLNDYLKSKTRFFTSLSSFEYNEFLNYEKPSFIVLNKLEKLNQLDITEEATLREIKTIFKIMDIYYLSIEINILLTKNLSFNSNRLNGFYCRTKMLFFQTVKKYYNELLMMKYFEEVKSLDNQNRINFTKNEVFDEFITQFDGKKEIKSILDIYCLAMGWCYKKKSEIIPYEDYCKISVALMVHLFFIKTLDLKHRAIKLVCDSILIDKLDLDLIGYLHEFQSALAYFIQYYEFKLTAQENSDLFDGRLFIFSLLLCNSTNFETTFKSLLVKCEPLSDLIEDGFAFLTNFFIKKQPKAFSYFDIFDLLASGKFTIQEKEFFNGSNGNDNARQKLDVKTLENTFFKKLANTIDIKVIDKSPTNLLKNVDDFYEYFDWFDYYEEDKKFQGKRDTGSNNARLDILSILSIEKVVKRTSNVNESHVVTTKMQSDDYVEVIKYIDENPDSLLEPKVVYIYLRCLYMNFVNLSNDQKQENISKLAVQILIYADKVWINYLNETKKMEMFQWVNDSIKLVVEILFYFKLDKLKKDLVTFLNSKSLVGVNSHERFELTNNFEEYQMNYLSDYLKNDMVSNKDKRTSMFKPDDWQVDFLNSIDKQQSMLILAPTSSGKTYASFYAMQKLLGDKKSPNSVIVYVAPTKALVSQTKFSIIQKFKHEKKKGKRGKETEREICGIFTRDCQENVFNCKILVTVPQCLHILVMNSEFCENNRIKYVIFDEIHNMGGEKGNEVWEHLIMLTKCPYMALSATVGNIETFHEWLQNLETHRSSGLRREVKLIKYNKRFSDLKRFIYSKTNLQEIHPISCLNISNVKKHGKIPNDINLTAAELMKLINSMKNVFGESILNVNIAPNRNFPSSIFITRDCVYEYGRKVLNLFEKLIINGTEESKIEQVIQSLCPIDYSSNDANVTDNDMIRLVEIIKKDQMLPCIFFTNHRYLCEKKAEFLTKSLNKMGIRLNEDFKESAYINGLISRSDYSLYAHMIDVGVAFHHSGLTPDLKAIIEALFRLGKIKVIFSTATLALGINMPCKTVVFMDDQIYLDSFQYRQASGRAGRRGYDFNGNVIFYDIPKSKVLRLIGSFIPELRPQFPLSLSIIMQLYNYAIEQKKNESKFNCLLDKSYWQYLYPSKGNQIRYDAIFSLNFLMDIQLIDKDGYVSAFNILLEVNINTSLQNIIYLKFIN